MKWLPRAERAEVVRRVALADAADGARRSVVEARLERRCHDATTPPGSVAPRAAVVRAAVVGAAVRDRAPRSPSACGWRSSGSSARGERRAHGHHPAADVDADRRGHDRALRRDDAADGRADAPVDVGHDGDPRAHERQSGDVLELLARRVLERDAADPRLDGDAADGIELDVGGVGGHGGFGGRGRGREGEVGKRGGKERRSAERTCGRGGALGGATKGGGTCTDAVRRRAAGFEPARPCSSASIRATESGSSAGVGTSRNRTKEAGGSSASELRARDGGPGGTRTRDVDSRRHSGRTTSFEAFPTPGPTNGGGTVHVEMKSRLHSGPARKRRPGSSTDEGGGAVPLRALGLSPRRAQHVELMESAPAFRRRLRKFRGLERASAGSGGGRPECLPPAARGPAAVGRGPRQRAIFSISATHGSAARPPWACSATRSNTASEKPPTFRTSSASGACVVPCGCRSTQTSRALGLR